MDEPLERRLAAILASDAAGYSRLMALDEGATVAALDAARAVFRRQIGLHDGRVVDTAGDSVLAIFGTAAGAVNAAMEVQNEISAGASAIPEASRMLFRVGVHLGDVMVKADGSVYGDGVNIAARLQALAQPGGITISDAVRGAVRGKVTATFVDLGEQTVKNILEPIRAFRVHAQDGRAAGPRTSDAIAAFSVDRPVKGFGGRPAIAVLPFDNMSNDPEQTYFADGIAEDILTRLATWRFMPVIGRNSSFAYRGKSIDLKQVGTALGARYILEGSVRKSGQRVRITGQLIDTETGHHIWAQRYDRVLEDIFAIQDEITDAIVGALEPAVGRAERGRARQKDAENLDAWDLSLRGDWHFWQGTPESFIEASKLYLESAQRDPEFAAPLAAAAMIKLMEALHGWSDQAQAIATAYELALKAKARDPLDPRTLAALSGTYAMAGQHDAALEISGQSVELNPSFAPGRFARAYVRLLCGDWQGALADAETGLRLSPNDFMAPVLLSILGTAHYMNREYEKSRDALLLAIQKPPPYPVSYRNLANTLGQLGRIEEGRQALARFLQLVPHYSTAVASRTHHFRNPADFEHYMAGLRKLGWNE